MTAIRYRSPSQERFAMLLEETPILQPYWDFKKGIMRDKDILRDMGAWSRSEQILARFYMGVWLGSDQHDFDFTDAAAHLDSSNKQIIVSWIVDPFWP